MKDEGSLTSSRDAEIDAKGRRILERLTFFSLVGGLTALIPIPFLDDWTYNRIRRRLVRELLVRNRLPPDRRLLDDLTASGAGLRGGCLYQGFFLLVLLPVKLLAYIFRRIARTVLFVLALKQMTDRTSSTFHEGFLLDAAMRRGYLRAGVEPGEVRRLQAAIRNVVGSVNTSPIRSIFSQVLRVNRSTVSQAARILGGLGRRARRDQNREDVEEDYLREEERLLGRIVTATADLLGGQIGYLGSLEQRLEAEWAAFGWGGNGTRGERL